MGIGIGNNNVSTNVMNNYFGGAGQMGMMQQNPVMQMMQMMMGSMQGLTGGPSQEMGMGMPGMGMGMPGMDMGMGMPGMGMGMPGMDMGMGMPGMGMPGFSPMMGNNIGNFLGMQQNPMMQMMQMMMQMMQMMMQMMGGGACPGMMGGMPGMGGGMPGMGGGMPGMGGGMPGGGGAGAYAGIGPDGKPYAGAYAGGANGAQGAQNGQQIQSGDGKQGTVIRQGKPIGANIAPAFDAMYAAAKADGVNITITSGFRSHEQQQALWNKNPNPKMVARPGTSQHEKGNALDLGPPGAYGWLKANAPKFGFKNYPPEPWHYSTTGH
jgi:hypothetical protein